MEDSVAAEEKRGELLGIALKWLRDDRDVRKQRDKERGTERGAKRQGDVSSISATDRAANMHWPFDFSFTTQTKDARTFYEKYDYNAGKAWKEGRSAEATKNARLYSSTRL
jgi:hypothetical protein